MQASRRSAARCRITGAPSQLRIVVDLTTICRVLRIIRNQTFEVASRKFQSIGHSRGVARNVMSQLQQGTSEWPATVD
jgi:hypothetical protein